MPSGVRISSPALLSSAQKSSKMEDKFKKIWELAIPYLKSGKRKDFVLHTEGVIKAMQLLLEREKGEEEILIPAAILHDVGWSRVPLELQKSDDKEKKTEGLRLHLEYAAPIIKEILKKCGFEPNKIKKVIEIVLSHKFQEPKELDKQLLIDADTLSDVFKEQFYADAKEYRRTPEEMYNFRKNNRFYTETAKRIFNKELEKRKNEI
jgi:HD superfamily phosphodiesterase